MDLCNRSLNVLKINHVSVHSKSILAKCVGDFSKKKKKISTNLEMM